MCGSCDYADVAYARELLGRLFRKRHAINYEDKFSTIMIQLKADAKVNPTLRKTVIRLSRAPEWMDQLTGYDINEGHIPRSIYEEGLQELQEPQELQELQVGEQLKGT